MTPFKPDNNNLFLKQATDLLNDLNIRYAEADFDDQIQLKEQLDRAMSNYAKARLDILKRTVICTADDVSKMQQLRSQLTKTPNVSQMLTIATSFASFIRKRFM